MTEDPKETKKPKQGETEKITKKTTDEKDKDFKSSGVEGAKDEKSETQNPKSEIVRGEDVVKILREKGHKI